MDKRTQRDPHPRSANSGRMSAEEFRALLGRSAQRGPRKATRVKSKAASAASESGLQRLIGGGKASTSALPLAFSLPFLPPSVNGLFATIHDNESGNLKRVLTNKARKARKAILTFVRGRLDPEAIYELHIRVELPALTQAGKLRKVDLTNRVKFLEDVVAKALQIDDRQFFRVVLDKVHADHERTLVEIRPYRAEGRDVA
ncbi:MAG: RusA family crossover junction endodeoxyribonuclease [Planctomycetes bacterium]|nr:RusA family crossover junction endodeoxyribonuclease [Planctomycetota bacterium]